MTHPTIQDWPRSTANSMTQPNCKPPITQKKLHTTLIAEPKIDEVQHQSPMYIPHQLQP